MNFQQKVNFNKDNIKKFKYLKTIINRENNSTENKLNQIQNLTVDANVRFPSILHVN